MSPMLPRDGESNSMLLHDFWTLLTPVEIPLVASSLEVTVSLLQFSS